MYNGSFVCYGMAYLLSWVGKSAGKITVKPNNLDVEPKPTK